VTFGDVYGLLIHFDQPVEGITVVRGPAWQVRKLGLVSILDGTRIRSQDGESVRVHWVPEEAAITSYEWLYMPTHELSDPYWVDWQINTSVSELPERGISHIWFPTPPACEYQEVHDVSFSISPDTCAESRHGTEICYFHVEPGGPSRIEQTARVSSLHKVWAVDVTALGEYDRSSREYVLYLSPSEHIQSAHPEIQALAKEIVGSETNPLLKCQRILSFVWSYGIHQPSGVKIAPPNFDALSVLQTKRGACGAFAALFVALARAAGIPARPVSGIAYLQSGKQSEQARGAAVNGHHVWAEFMLPGEGWIPVDPTTRMMGALEGNRIVMSWGCDFDLPCKDVEVLWFHIPIGLTPGELRDGVPSNDRQQLEDVIVRRLGIRRTE